MILRVRKEICGSESNFVVLICFRHQKNTLKLNVGREVNCTLGQKPRVVSVQLAERGPLFRKNGGNGILLNWPQEQQT